MVFAKTLLPSSDMELDELACDTHAPPPEVSTKEEFPLIVLFAMLTLTPSESVEGLYSGRLIIYMGGVPEKILRTQLIQVAIRS